MKSSPHGNNEPSPVSAIRLLENGRWPNWLSRNQGLLTKEEQIRLLKSTAAVIGLGGLGGYIATLLARLGTGGLILVDHDVFDETNINRQALAFTDTLHAAKTAVSAQRLKTIHSEIRIIAWEASFDLEKGKEMLNQADIVMDGLDSIQSRKLLYQVSMELGIPMIHGAVSGWSGQSTTFLSRGKTTIDDIYPGTEEIGPPPAVLSPVVAVIAGIQCMEAVRILAGRKAQHAETMVFYDGETSTLRHYGLT